MNMIGNTKDSFDFGAPVRLHFGEGLVDKLADFCPEAGRVLVVTGMRSAGESGLSDRICRALKGKHVEFFSEVEQNPSIETVERGGAVAARMESDLVIGAGGGSAMDAAKVIAVLCRNSGGFRSLIGKQDYDNRPVRMIAVPTTCGTGSEANRFAIITDTQQHDKVNFSSRATYPAIGILDPRVLDRMPARTLVGTACDAFTHAFEGYTSRRSQPFSDAIALNAMELIVAHLPAAVQNDPTAKANLLYASSLAGIVTDHVGTTVLHAMGYYLTLRHGVPHGEANAALIPLLFDHLDGAIPDKTARVRSLFPPERREPDGIKEFLNGLDVKTALSSYGMGKSEIADCADYVLARKNTANTAGTVTKELLTGLLNKHIDA